MEQQNQQHQQNTQNQMPLSSPKKKRLNIKSKALHIVVLVVIILILGGIFVLMEMRQSEPAAQTPPLASPSPQPQTPDISTWQIYRNDEFGFEVRYPENFFFQTQKDLSFIKRDGGILGVTFADNKLARPADRKSVV